MVTSTVTPLTDCGERTEEVAANVPASILTETSGEKKNIYPRETITSLSFLDINGAGKARQKIPALKRLAVREHFPNQRRNLLNGSSSA